MEPVYVTREEFSNALDVKASAYMRAEVDRACRSGSRAAEALLHRIFYPEVLTRTFDYPRDGQGRGNQQLWFDERALVSLTSISSGGTAIPNASLLLRPDGAAPYDYIEMNRASNYSFAGGPQRAVTMTGLWGYRNDEVPAGTLVGAIDGAATALVTSASVDVGSILRIDSERVLVAERGWTASGQTAPSLAANKPDVNLAVADGTAFTIGEDLLIDAERLTVVDIAGNSVIVRRASGGSVLAAHTAGAGIFWQHRYLVERGALGTAAAAHAGGASAARWEPPSLVKELAQAYAEDAFLQRNNGYARTVGTGDSERQVGGRGITQVEIRARAQYGRKVRRRAV